MKSLAGKVVWITGASAGIGEATAKELAKEGVKLVLSARRKEELERVKSNLNLPENDVLVLPLDIEKIDSLVNACQQVINKFGRIDLLFNNAGISQRGDVKNSGIEVYKRLMEVNFYGVVALTKAVLPFMEKQNEGHIVVTSSISGKIGTPLRSGYSASKHALHGFFDSLRSEVYKNNINVTIVCPGYINTDISVNALDTSGNKHGKKDNNQLKGLSAETCAKAIVKAIKKNKKEIYVGGKEVLGVYLKRFLPSLLYKIVLSQAPK
jgi:short-subunit dehydrogenase